MEWLGFFFPFHFRLKLRVNSLSTSSVVPNLNMSNKRLKNNNIYTFKPFVFIKSEPRLAQDRSRVPLARSGHRIVCDEKNLYSFGGYNPLIPEEPDIRYDPVWLESRPLFKELWRYNFASKMWKRLSCNGTVPNELASSAVILGGGTMMIYGGTGYPFGDSCSNQLYVCNLREDYKMQLVNVEGSLPPKQYGQALVLDGPYLYTIGGTTGFYYTADVHRLDLQTGIWEEVYMCTGSSWREPQGRYRHELAFDGTRIYILGGGTAEEVYGFQEIPAFNIFTRVWENLIARCDSEAPSPGFPASRRCHGCVQVPAVGQQKPTVYVCGGYNGTEMFHDVWKLDLQTLQWTQMLKCRLPRAVYFHSVAITPLGCMYSFGGITEGENNTRRTSDVHCAWMCIPKLTEICWEAILHYNPDLHLLSREQLLNCGLPLKYVNRIECE